MAFFPNKVLFKNHKKSCKQTMPPGEQIYLEDDISVFELDGKIQREYCENLCLVSKLFLDHKTLYFDVDPSDWGEDE